MGEFRDRITGFAIPMHYYGENKEYLIGQVLEESTRRSGKEGRMQDGVWHPKQVVNNAERTVAAPHRQR
jgi:hypothetical protein